MTARCHRTALVEARLDGRLGAAEVASLERHLPTCEECASRLRELEVLRADVRELSAKDDLPPLAHQRARLALLRKAAEPTRAPRKRRAVWIGIALVFAPAAVFAARRAIHAASSPGAPEAPALPSAPTSEPTSTGPVAPLLRGPAPAEPSAAVAAPSARDSAPRAFAPRASDSASRPSVPPRSGASRDFAEAVDAVSRGDFGAGAARLERFTRDYPQDPRAEEALYLEAIALERAGRRDEARAVARRYLDAYPAGAHATHAHQMME